MKLASHTPSFLVIDDDEVDNRQCQRNLRECFGRDAKVDAASTWEEAVQAVETRSHDVYLVDHFMGARTGLDLLRRYRKEMPDHVFILLTGLEDRNIDLEAAKVGASDYLVKADLSPARLERSIRFALAMNAQQRELFHLSQSLQLATEKAQEDSRKHLALAQELEATQDKLTNALARAKESEKQNRLVLDALPIAVAYMDKNERYVLANALACEWFATPEQDLIGKAVKDIHAREYDRLKPTIDAVLSGKTVTGQKTITYRDGVTRDVQVYTAPNLAADGSVLGWYGVSEEVTARNRAEEALREKAAVIETTMRTIPDGLMVLDRDLRLAAWNEQLFSVLGLNKNCVLGAKNAGQKLCVFLTDLGGFGDGDCSAIAEMQDGVQFERQLENGTWIEYRGFPIEGGEGWVAVFRDISERRALEKLKKEFVTTVSHELRTPLTSIFGSLGLYLNQDSAKQNESPELLNIAYRNCERLVELVDDILDMEKIESGKIDYELLPVSISELVLEAMETNAPYGERFGVTFVVEGDIPEITVLGNYKGLLQIFANLLSNASKYSDEGGNVGISVKNVDGWATVEVRDEGPGIPEEYQDAVFEKFSKVDSDTPKPVPGTGLGLSISRAIIEHHYGEIGVQSRPGKGSTFFFKLPLAAA